MLIVLMVNYLADWDVPVEMLVAISFTIVGGNLGLQIQAIVLDRFVVAGEIADMWCSAHCMWYRKCSDAKESSTARMKASRSCGWCWKSPCRWFWIVCRCHNYVGHNYVGHNYVGHNYVGHNYVGHNYVGRP